MTSEVAERASASGRLAIDTEFVGERRYQAQLCLAQVAVSDPGAPDGVRTEVLDPLVGELDAGPIARVLADPGVEVVVHAGRQDIAILRRSWRTDVRNVFDTQVAAGFLGFSNQEGYESLVARVLGVKLRGGEGFARWDRRPLTEAQLAYARDDARLLLALGDALERRLAEAGRLEWASEECRALEQASDERDPDTVYERLPRPARLDPARRAVARELVAWREEVAREVDRPPAYVLPDHVLVELARRMPADRAALEHVRGLPQQTLHRRARALLEAVERGRSASPPPPTARPQRGDPHDQPLVALAQALVRYHSLESGVAVELIATRSELDALVGSVRREEPVADGIRVLRGWRRELVGDELLELLSGRRVLSVDRDGRLHVTSRE